MLWAVQRDIYIFKRKKEENVLAVLIAENAVVVVILKTDKTIGLSKKAY